MTCTKHKHYQAERKPTSGCSACWKLWRAKHRRKKDADHNVGRLEDDDMLTAATTVVLAGLLIDNLLD